MMRDINARVWKLRLACPEVKFGFKFCRAVYEKVAFQLYSLHCLMANDGVSKRHFWLHFSLAVIVPVIENIEFTERTSLLLQNKS